MHAWAGNYVIPHLEFTMFFPIKIKFSSFWKMQKKISNAFVHKTQIYSYKCQSVMEIKNHPSSPPTHN